MRLKAEANSGDKALSIAWWILFVLVLALTAAIRIRLLTFPLERDEGEYAYAGQLILHGVFPYKLAYNMKFPGTYAAYALIMSIFGQSTVGVHLGLLVVNLGAILLIFLLGRRLLNTMAGIVAGSTYAILSVSPWVAGFAAHATHFVVLAVLGGALLLLRAAKRQSRAALFCSGALFGIGLLMKQPGIWFAIFGAIHLLLQGFVSRIGPKKIVGSLMIFAAGVLAPLAISCGFLWRAGVFARFWFWTIQYAREYGGLVSLSQGIDLFGAQITAVIGANWLLWGLAAVGLFACLAHPQTRRSGGFLIGWLIASTLALCAGFYFREHYFVLVLPAISLLTAAAIAVPVLPFAQSRPGRILALAIFAAALALPLFSDREFLFTLSPSAACRSVYYPNPFPECIQIANFLRQRTNSDDRIAVLGSEPEIYFYSDRRSATGFIYMYALMEPQKYAQQMQREMEREIEQARPKCVVLVAIPDSWLAWPQSDRGIFTWANEYCRENYMPVGLVTLSEERSEYYFAGPLPSFDSARPYILIYERKS